MKILIVEDEKELSTSMATYLQRENYTCDIAYNVNEGRIKMETFDYDCILLDISLPDGNGLQILKELKVDKKLDGVIIISAKNSLDDKIAGLNLGADDYISKPFHLSELSARISAIIRRKRFQGNTVLVLNELTVDLVAKTVLVHNKPVELTRKEFDLLLYLLSNKNRVISKNAIAETLSGEDVHLYDNFDFLYAHMKNLKKKLTGAGCADYIKSIYGMGYKFAI
ncbi:MAG: response regulator transcription factor [Ferruginibacter sp.]